MAWLGEVEKLPIYGSGANVVPTVHVNDLAGYVCFMIFNFFLCITQLICLLCLCLYCSSLLRMPVYLVEYLFLYKG